MTFSNNIFYSPKDYQAAAIVPSFAGKELLSRLELIPLNPEVVLDVGSGPGEMSVLLQKQYPKATVIALDLSLTMLTASKSAPLLCADANQTPFPEGCVDFIFANFLLPWQPDVKKWLKECVRLLKPNGLLMFSALGPDTLQEWRKDLQKHFLFNVMDMHDIGDLLQQTGFADPVLDRSYFTTSYKQKAHLFNELHHNGLVSPISELFIPNAPLEATFEVIYAHAFAPLQKNISAPENNITKIPLSALRITKSLKT